MAVVVVVVVVMQCLFCFAVAGQPWAWATESVIVITGHKPNSNEIPTPTSTPTRLTGANETSLSTCKHPWPVGVDKVPSAALNVCIYYTLTILSSSIPVSSDSVGPICIPLLELI